MQHSNSKKKIKVEKKEKTKARHRTNCSNTNLNYFLTKSQIQKVIKIQSKLMLQLQFTLNSKFIPICF